MKIFDTILRFLESQATVVPLELFATIASFVEEIVAPIPSPIVMVLAGTLAQAQNQQLWYLAWLSLFGAFGKTLGALVLYIIVDKLEDIFTTKFGKFLGVTHKDVENIGRRLHGGWQDNVFLFIVRAIPIIPSAPISIACGAIKLNQKTFISSTFAGTFFRNLMYLYLGYAGLGNYREISQELEGFESIGQLVLFILVAIVIGWAYYKRKKTF